MTIKDSIAQGHDTLMGYNAVPDGISLHNVKVAPFRADTAHVPTDSLDAVVRTDFSELLMESCYDSLDYCTAEVPHYTTGMYSEPLSYSLRNDNLIMSLLFVCFFFMMSIFSAERRNLREKISGFFFEDSDRDSSYYMETGHDKRNHFFFVLQTSLVIGILFFDYTLDTKDIFMSGLSPYTLFALYSSGGILYFAIKKLVYRFVNWTFFDKEQIKNWRKSYYFILSFESILLFLFVMTIINFNFTLSEYTVFLLSVLGILKIFLFYKCFNIFFKKVYGFLHLIVYFCALEILPLIGLWEVLNFTNNILL